MYNLKAGFKQFVSYNMDHLTGDVTAGITVAFLLIPQSMAYASLAGVPPIIGLYASTFPLLIYAVFGGSKYLSVGPVSAVSMLTFTGLSGLISTGDHHYLELVVMLSLISGIIQIIMGLFKFGSLIKHISSAVIGGFISALALIIIVNQLPTLLGNERPPSYHNFFVYFYDLMTDLSSIHIMTMGIGLISFLLLLVIRKLLSASSGSFVVIFTSIMIVDFFHMEQKGVAIVGTVSGNFSAIPRMIIPSWSIIPDLLQLAIIIGFVSFFESFSVAQSLADKDGEIIDINQELVGLGMANLTSSFAGGMPVSGALSRSAVYYESGAQTKFSLIITALLMLFAILYITPLFYYLPKATLAAIIVFAVLKLININQLIYYLKNELDQSIIFLITFLSTIMIGLIKGLISGLTIFLIVRGLQKLFR